MGELFFIKISCALKQKIVGNSLEGPNVLESHQFYTNPGKSKTPPNSETQKLQLRNSESPSFRVSEAESPSRTISGSFGVGSKSPKHYVYSGRTHFGSFRAGFFFGQNRATQKLRLKNSETQTQKGLVFRVSESDFPSFRVVEGFPCREGPCVDSNTLGPQKLYREALKDHF